jgi:pimeloyl-ACP methyl ester carboxylesterase
LYAHTRTHTRVVGPDADQIDRVPRQPLQETMRSVFRIALFSIAVGCGGNTNQAPDATPPDAAAPTVNLAVACTDTTDGVYADAPASLPAFDASHRGDIFRCAKDRWLDAAAVDAIARANGYLGAPLTSGATIFRIAYRTERTHVGAAPPAEGHSGGFLLVPDHPRTPGALVVYAHPSVGIAPSCAPSHIDLSIKADGWEPVRAPLLGLVGAGWTVIAPDEAGMGFGDAPGFADAEDEGKSILDATRAATKLLPADLLPGKVVIVGHSMGGHAALSAHALAKSYGHDGELVGVATFAPFWLTNLAWAAILSEASGVNTTTGAYLLEYQLDYFYGHGELLDGAGHGVDLIQPDKAAAVKTLVTTQCLDGVATGLKSFGVYADSYYTDAAVTALSNCGFTGDCPDAPGPVWKARFIADRPPIDPAGPPIVMWFGGKDTTVSPPYARCAMDKVATDMASGGTTAITTCADADAVHTGVPARDVAWVTDWIAAQVGGGTAPTCTPPADPSAGGATCPKVPPNSF